VTPAEYWALYRADPHATPFQSPAWVEAWWRHLGSGERVDVVARDEAGRALAALPCFVWNEDAERRLAPLGAGNSDYCDALVDPGVADAPARLWAALERERWDALWWPDLREGSALLGALPAGWRVEEEAHETCPVLAIPADGDVLGALSRSRRRKIVHDRNRAEALGGVETRLAEPHELEEALDALFALHAARWQAAGEPGVLAEERTRAFLREAADGLAAAGLLRVAVVRHGGAIVAVLLGFCDGRRGYSYINGTAFVPGQSFGTLAFGRMIEAAAAEGARAFHFLRGEEPYKYGWGAEPTVTRRRVVRRG